MLVGMQPHQDGPLARLRRGHEDLVLDLLRKHGPLSRAELGQHSGLSRTTLSDIVTELIESGAVVATAPGTAPRRRGRPVEALTLNPSAGQAIGIDFARRAVHVSAVNVAHEVIGSASEPHDPGLPWEERITLAERLVGTLAEGALRLGALNAIGVGVVGPVEGPDAGPDAGPAQPCPSADLPALLRKRFEAPVLVDNNTRLAALAEATWGAAAGGQDVLYLRLSHGVGGGLVVAGALHRGAYGLSGEFGHIAVESGDGRCSCGATGCLETVASVGAVLAAYRRAGGHADGLAALLGALEAGDPVALRTLEVAGTHIGTVLAAVCNAIGPGVIVLGGELAAAGPPLFEPVERALRAHIMPISRDRVDLRPAALGEAGGALGGIALVLCESPLLSHYPARPG
ncbi:ROK family transcriptional regulator [Streptomyces iranensis]|uniref:ROK family protein n=2 Tax=Streptomyces iranensis TaxID=576784 RepID=A0A061A9I0_9ACTN|nr:ROK family transcriptional regulator [Streptomyces iranensis]CDR16550.1 ROK family protein [Streptomyces iranensis]